MAFLKSKVSDFAYIVARVRVMRRKLLPKEDYPRLLHMEIPQIARYLEETEYKEDIDALSTKFSGIDLIEYALNNNMARTFTKLIDISEGQPNLMIREYLRRWDVWNIKAILRGIYYGAKYSDIVKTLIPAGEFSLEFLLEVSKKMNFEEVLEELKGTIYHSVLEEVFKKYELRKGESLLDVIENELEKLYYERVAEMIEPSTPENALFLKFFKTEIDIVNLKSLFRMIRAGVEQKKILDVLIFKGLKISNEDLKKLSSLTYQEFFRSLENYPYYNAIKDLRDEPNSEIEKALEKYLNDYSYKVSHYYPLSILPVLLYIRGKTAEVTNLRTIVRAKEMELPIDEIRELLVI